MSIFALAATEKGVILDFSPDLIAFFIISAIVRRSGASVNVTVQEAKFLRNTTVSNNIFERD
jgi:hypothetical protein